ncbi:DUF3541 domain-containing protein [Vibrio chagasii]|nr:DUF3541 domain-containing protein [Vibrio chagasii]
MASTLHSPSVQEGHYGLRMYRQTLADCDKYAAAVWSDMADQPAGKLSSLSNDVHTMEQIVLLFRETCCFLRR